MSTNRINYPHAVLGNGEDILPSIKADDIQFVNYDDSDPDKITFDVTFELRNEEILRLINEGYAKYSVEVLSKLCPIRLNFNSDKPSVRIELDKDYIGSDTTLYPVIVVTKEILECNINGLDPNFDGLPTGRNVSEYLAIYGKWNLNPKNNIRSIMSFVKGTNFDTHPKFNFTNEDIEITLPPLMYQIYAKYNEDNKDFNNIIISSIVVEALYIAFNLICKGSFSNKQWHKSIKDKCYSSSVYKNFDFQDVMVYPELINEILQNQYSRLFTSVDKLIKRI